MNVQIKCFAIDSEEMSNPEYVSLSEKVFRYPFNISLIHQVISSYLINSRQGSKAQKSRAEVSGSGKKPWRQKGTGRARSGAVSSPIWRSGGVTFASKPKQYHQKINKKMYRGAMRSILSKLLSDDRLFLIESLYLEKTKTKILLEKLRRFLSYSSVLVVTDSLNRHLVLSARNLHNVEIRDLSCIDPVSLVKFGVTLFTKSAINKIEKQLI